MWNKAQFVGTTFLWILLNLVQKSCILCNKDIYKYCRYTLSKVFVDLNTKHIPANTFLCIADRTLEQTHLRIVWELYLKMLNLGSIIKTHHTNISGLNLFEK